MNTLQKARIMANIATLAESTQRTAAHGYWIELRQSSESGVILADLIPRNALTTGDGVFWTWQPIEGRVFIKAQVNVFEALEAVDALQELPFTSENGDC